MKLKLSILRGKMLIRKLHFFLVRNKRFEDNDYMRDVKRIEFAKDVSIIIIAKVNKQ